MVHQPKFDFIGSGLHIGGVGNAQSTCTFGVNVTFTDTIIYSFANGYVGGYCVSETLAMIRILAMPTSLCVRVVMTARRRLRRTSIPIAAYHTRSTMVTTMVSDVIAQRLDMHPTTSLK